MFENIRYRWNKNKCETYVNLFLKARDRGDKRAGFFRTMASMYGGQALLLSEHTTKIDQGSINSTRRVFLCLRTMATVDKFVQATESSSKQSGLEDSCGD